jgi:hypothetical protein
MKRIGYTLSAIGLCLAIGPQAASAHHSGAMYDPSKIVTLKGTVQQFRWVNPHVVIVVAVEDGEGSGPVPWAIEMSSPGNMRRYGWSGGALRVGESVEITAAPMRDGSHGGACRTVKALDTGKSLDCSGLGAIHAGETPNLPAR